MTPLPMTHDYARIYIEDMIVVHLRRLTQGQETGESVPWNNMERSLSECIRKGDAYMPTLHAMMEPYYLEFFRGNTALCKHGPSGGFHFMNRVINADREFTVWASRQDLIACAEGWGDNMKRMNTDDVWYFFLMMSLLISEPCVYDWHALGEELKGDLFNAEAYSDYRTDELLCVLHALAMIMQSDWPIEKKRETFEMLREHWGFMKHVYSVMIRHIVGSRQNNFAAVAHTVMNTNANLPHLEIFYCVLTDRLSSLGLELKKYKKVDDALRKMEGKIQTTKQSETLYELCDILFPEDFQRMLIHRPRNNGELMEEIERKDQLLRQMEHQSQSLLAQIEELTNTCRAAVEAAIPVDDIKSRLLALPYSTAWDIYSSLDRLLKTHPTWRKYDSAIYEALEEKRLEEAKRDEEFRSSISALASHPTSVTNIREFNNRQGTFNDNSGATINAMIEGRESVRAIGRENES